MIQLLTDPQAWAALVTLTAMEIILGIDNVEECSPEYASGSTASSLLRDVNTLTNVPSIARRAEEWSGSLSHQLGEKFVYVRKDW